MPNKTYSFKAHVQFHTKVVVPPAAVEQFRKWAKANDATPFLRMCQSQHPEDDDAFVGLIVKNALRGHTRDNCVALIADNGMTGTVSPVKIEMLALGSEELVGDLVPNTEPVVIDVNATEKEQ